MIFSISMDNVPYIKPTINSRLKVTFLYAFQIDMNFEKYMTNREYLCRCSKKVLKMEKLSCQMIQLLGLLQLINHSD